MVISDLLCEVRIVHADDVFDHPVPEIAYSISCFSSLEIVLLNQSLPDIILNDHEVSINRIAAAVLEVQTKKIFEAEYHDPCVVEKRLSPPEVVGEVGNGVELRKESVEPGFVEDMYKSSTLVSVGDRDFTPAAERYGDSMNSATVPLGEVQPTGSVLRSDLLRLAKMPFSTV